MTEENIARDRNGRRGEVVFSSNEMRLNFREWLIALGVLIVLIYLLGFVWGKVEKFEVVEYYRIPYKMSEDYWLFKRYCESVCAEGRSLVIGDSVVWGQYVEKGETLSHYLNELSGGQRFANMGLDGLHPVAMFGLLKYYGGDIYGRDVLIHFNPLWLSSSKYDLRSDKEFSFNHPRLVPQFFPEIASYKASFSSRIGVIIERNLSFLGCVKHINLLCFADDELGVTDFCGWLMEHPYENPFMDIAGKLQKLDEKSPVRKRQAGAKVERRYDLPWIDLEMSLQWTYFKKTIELLQQRGNRVFVVVGPFNEHIIEQESLTRYHEIKRIIGAWLVENEVDCYVPSVLAEGHYADASHPIGEGYAFLAEQVLENDFWSPSEGN